MRLTLPTLNSTISKMIDKRIRMEMRVVAGSRERAVIDDCGWSGGTSSRKALLVIEDDPSGGRVLTLDDLHDAVLQGLPSVAQAGSGRSEIDIADVITGYDTDVELPVLFVGEDSGGQETLSIFLYDMPVTLSA